MVACGGNFTLALGESGEIYSWGEGVTGALGTGFSKDEWAPKKITLEILKNEASGKAGSEEKAMHIAAGYCHAIAVSQNGSLYAWGNNEFGQLGIDLKHTNKPEKVTALKNRMEKVACGMFHSAGISQEEYLFTWGANKNGQLGQLDYSNRRYPERVFVNELKDESIRWVTCGPNHTLVISRSGQMYGFGNNASNRLGCAEYKLKMNKNLQPTKINLHSNDEKDQVKSGEILMQVATSSNCSMALKSNGTLYTWGKNFKRCLGRDVRDDKDDRQSEQNEERVQDDGHHSFHTQLINHSRSSIN